VRPAAPGTGAQAGPVAIRAPGPASVVPTPRVCLDCGAPLTGKFCTVCGQKDEPLERGLGDLAREFLRHPLIDTKLWRSLVPLLLRPGLLTEEYLAGRRTRYVRPLKLYLTISVTFFALLALTMSPDEVVKMDVKHDKPAADGAPPETLHLPIRWLDERFQRNTAGLDDPNNPAARRALAGRVTGAIPKVVFVLLPLSALLFKLFWWRRYFVEHLVFTLHLHSFAFLAGMVRFLDWAPVTAVVGIGSCVYMGVAFKRVYRQRWGTTLAKLFGVGLCYSALLAAGMSVATLTALVW
jgi:Protein of unknown function (DUF3667)